MAANTLGCMLCESEAVLIQRVSARREMSTHQYLRWLLNRFLLEEGRRLLPAPQLSPRNWPHNVAMNAHTYHRIRERTSTPRPKRITLRTKMPDPDLPSVSELLRALIHDDARRLGIMFSPEWTWRDHLASIHQSMSL